MRLLWPRGSDWYVENTCHWPREYLHCSLVTCSAWVPLPGVDSHDDETEVAVALHGWSRDRWDMVVCPEHA